MKLRRQYNYPQVYLPRAGANGINMKASSTNNLMDPNRPPSATSSSASLVQPSSQPSKSQPHLQLCEDVTQQFDYTFWAGDLNYRVDLPRETADKCLQKGDLEVNTNHPLFAYGLRKDGYDTEGNRY